MIINSYVCKVDKKFDKLRAEETLAIIRQLFLLRFVLLRYICICLYDFARPGFDLVMFSFFTRPLLSSSPPYLSWSLLITKFVVCWILRDIAPSNARCEAISSSCSASVNWRTRYCGIMEATGFNFHSHAIRLSRDTESFSRRHFNRRENVKSDGVLLVELRARRCAAA